MVTLTDAEKEMIISAGAQPNADWTRVSFEKKHKPNRKIKKLLTANGYVINPSAGRKFEPMMEYELVD